MRKIILCLILVAMVASLFGNSSTPQGLIQSQAINPSEVSGNMQDFKATFKKGGFFGIFQEPGDPTYFIIRTPQAMEAHIQSVMANFRRDTATVPDPYLQTLESQVRDFYAGYDDNFFEKNFLVVALVAQGSGSFRYSLESLNLTNQTLTINITHNAPMIQTMDFVATTLLLELPTESYNVSTVQVIVAP